MTTTDHATLTAAALALANRGWRVFPLAPGSKRPAFPNHSQDRCDHTDPWCRHAHVGWEPRATDDQGRITRCWATGHGWNIGVAAGASGLIVVDLDMPKPGEAPPAEWALLDITSGADVFAGLAARARQPVPTTFTVTTPSGGRHLYFTAPPGHRLRNTAGRLGWRIDTRAHGGYVVAPGSITPTGPYTITNNQPPAPLPAWLTHALTVRPSTAVTAPAQTAVTHLDRYLRSTLDAEINLVRAALPGEHNKTLFDAALTLGRLVASGELPEATVRAALLDAYGVHLANPACDCTESQARRTISCGLGYGAQRPRRIPATRSTTDQRKGSAA